MSSVELRILELETQRCDAIIAENFAVLDKLLAEDFLYRHASGRTDTKQTYMAARREGLVRFTRFAKENLRVRVFKDCVAVVTGNLRSWLVQQQTPKMNDHHFTAIWIDTADDWRLARFEAVTNTETEHPSIPK